MNIGVNVLLRGISYYTVDIDVDEITCVNIIPPKLILRSRDDSLTLEFPVTLEAFRMITQLINALREIQNTIIEELDSLLKEYYTDNPTLVKLAAFLKREEQWAILREKYTRC